MNTLEKMEGCWRQLEGTEIGLEGRVRNGKKIKIGYRNGTEEEGREGNWIGKYKGKIGEKGGAKRNIIRNKVIQRRPEG